MGRAPQLFLSKAWGFDAKGFSVFGLSTAGARDAYRRIAVPGDWILVVGTLGEETPPPLRGRILGRVQVDATTQLATAPFLREVGYEFQDNEFDENGEFRWPHGMLTLRALELVDKPDLCAFADERFGRQGTVTLMNLEEQLGSAVCAQILALECRELALPSHPELDRLRQLDANLRVLRRRSGATGPPPAQQSAGHARVDQGGSAYLLRLSGGKITPAYKIGFALDVEERIHTLNKEIRPALTGCRWSKVRAEVFPTERQAYAFEQALLERLSRWKVEGELEVVSVHESVIATAWDELVIQVLMQK